jgi:hypothetical protein
MAAVAAGVGVVSTAVPSAEDSTAAMVAVAFAVVTEVFAAGMVAEGMATVTAIGAAGDMGMASA